MSQNMRSAGYQGEELSDIMGLNPEQFRAVSKR